MIALIRKDWQRYGTIIAILTMTMLTLVLFRRTGLSDDRTQHALEACIAISPFLYAQACFFFERRLHTFELLQSLPITPGRLIAAKYASLISMTLFTVNVPGILLGSARFLFYANALALLMATAFAAPVVVSKRPWTHQIMFFVVLYLRSGTHLDDWVRAHATTSALLAYAIATALIASSTWYFSVKSV